MPDLYESLSVFRDKALSVYEQIERDLSRLSRLADTIERMADKFNEFWVDGDKWEGYSDAYGSVGTQLIEIAERFREPVNYAARVKKMLNSLSRVPMNEAEEGIYDEIASVFGSRLALRAKKSVDWDIAAESFKRKGLDIYSSAKDTVEGASLFAVNSIDKVIKTLSENNFSVDVLDDLAESGLGLVDASITMENLGQQADALWALLDDYIDRLSNNPTKNDRYIEKLEGAARALFYGEK